MLLACFERWTFVSTRMVPWSQSAQSTARTKEFRCRQIPFLAERYSNNVSETEMSSTRPLRAGQISMGKIALCTFAVLIAAVTAQNTTAPSEAPIAFAPTRATEASAPSPQIARVRTGQYASDSLATTPTSLNQIQVHLVDKISSTHPCVPSPLGPAYAQFSLGSTIKSAISSFSLPSTQPTGYQSTVPAHHQSPLACI